MESRVRNAIARLPDVDAFVVSSASNRFYLSGFRGSAGTLFITPGAAYYITDGRYAEAVGKAVKGMEVVNGIQPAHHEVAALCGVHGVKRLGIEDRDMTVAVYNIFKEAMPDVELVPVRDAIVGLRAVKDAQEIEKLQNAQAVADRAFLEVLDFIAAGRTEKECAKVLEDALYRFGAEGLAFPTIAVGGTNSSQPHGKPSAYVLQQGDFLTMDFGVVLEGYVSDMTRTVAIGRPSDEMRTVYDTVLRAQLAAIDAASPGVVCSDVDKAARDIIEEAGYGEHFVHNLGHSFGIDIHESPRFSSTCTDLLEPGMCITVEPGVYLPGRFGVRIEDTVVVTQGGVRNFTTGPKHLIEL